MRISRTGICIGSRGSRIYDAAARDGLDPLARRDPCRMIGEGVGNDPVIVSIVGQHADELASLWITRRALVGMGATSLATLADQDERIAAHLDGCVVGGATALEILQKQVGDSEPSAAFALAVVALERQDPVALERAVRAADNAPECVAGVESALEWTSSTRLVGVVQALLQSGSALRHRLGLVACRAHVANLGPTLVRTLDSEDAGVTLEALRLAAALGRVDALPVVQKREHDSHEDIAAAAAAASVLLGNRGRSLDALRSIVCTKCGKRELLELVLRASDVSASQALLQRIARETSGRPLIIGAGVTGDPRYVPWLIKQMEDPKHARLAGEAFSTMTGIDLSAAGLDRGQPERFDSGPTDDPADEEVGLDEDEGLPWPHPEKVARWWSANGVRFGQGSRWFIGQPLSREHCATVLKTGYQRQRAAAAQYLCLLDPGTCLFNTSAPAWRQQKLLAQLS